MRLWSLHPKYVDRVGVVAMWNEGLQGLDSTLGAGKMHKNHPQKQRFKCYGKEYEAAYLVQYLLHLVYIRDDINFNPDLLFKRVRLMNKLYITTFIYDGIPISTKQVAYEQWWLYESIRGRSLNKAISLLSTKTVDLDLHPLFYKVPGEIENWEKVK